MRLHSPRWTRGAVLGLLVAAGSWSGDAPLAPAWAQPVTRLYVTVDRAQVLDLQVPARKVAVANPNIADVQVINPAQLLVNGKTVGTTSLIVFSGAASRQQFDLVVNQAPLGGTGGPPVATGDPYSVLVQRGDKMTEQVFTRDKDERWLELGQVKLETDSGKK